MVIKNTQKKGISITNKVGEIILEPTEMTILRKEADKNGKMEYVITTPGEYEVEQIAVTAFPPFPSVIIQIEQNNIVYLPNPADNYPAEVINEMERVDILILPGKRYDLVEKLAPLLVIPLDDTALMAEKMGAEIPEAVKSLAIKDHADLPEETQLINLSL